MTDAIDNTYSMTVSQGRFPVACVSLNAPHSPDDNGGGTVFLEFGGNDAGAIPVDFLHRGKPRGLTAVDFIRLAHWRLRYLNGMKHSPDNDEALRRMQSALGALAAAHSQWFRCARVFSSSRVAGGIENGANTCIPYVGDGPADVHVPFMGILIGEGTVDAEYRAGWSVESMLAAAKLLLRAQRDSDSEVRAQMDSEVQDGAHGKDYSRKRARTDAYIYADDAIDALRRRHLMRRRVWMVVQPIVTDGRETLCYRVADGDAQAKLTADCVFLTYAAAADVLEKQCEPDNGWEVRELRGEEVSRDMGFWDKVHSGGVVEKA